MRSRLLAAAAVLVVSLIVGVVLLWPRTDMETIDQREFSVLIVGPGADGLRVPLQGMGFAVETTQRSEGLPALLERAKEGGHGYLALHPPHLYDFEAIGAEAAPPGVNAAVVRLEDRNVTFAGPAPGIATEGTTALFVGMVLALFEQPGYAKLLEVGVPQDLDRAPAALSELDEAGTLAQVRSLQAAHADLSTLEPRWNEARDAVPWMVPTTPLGDPFASTQGFPLANGGVLLLVSPGRWTLATRTTAKLGHGDAQLHYLSPEALASSAPTADLECGARFGTDIEGITVNATGDAVAVRRQLEEPGAGRRGTWRVDAWRVGTGTCPFEPVGLPDRGTDPRMMGLVSSDGILWPVGSSGSKPDLEREDRRDALPTRRRTVAWAGPGLVLHTASFVRGNASVAGVAVVEPDPVEPRAAFIRNEVLFAPYDGSRVVQIDPVEPDTFIAVTDGCEAMKLTFRRPARDALRPVKPREDIPRRADLGRGAFRRTWLRLPEQGGYACGPVSFSRSGTIAVLRKQHVWTVSNTADDVHQPLLKSEHGMVQDVLVAPDGRSAVAHVWLRVEGHDVLTSFWLTLPFES